MNFIHSYEKDLYKKLKKKLYEKKKEAKYLDNSNFYEPKEDSRIGYQEPQSPSSEKVDKSTLFSDKYSTNNFIKTVGAERSHSELLKPSFKMTYSTNKRDPEVKRLKTDKNETFRHEIYDATTGKK